MNRLTATVISTALAVLAGCSNFSQPFGNIEQDVKTRPLAVTLDPCQAAPGDTVTVTAYIYTIEPGITVDWTGQRDYYEIGYGIAGPGTVPEALDEIPGSHVTSPPDADGLVTHTMQFMVPDDALSGSRILPSKIGLDGLGTAERTMFGIPSGADSITNVMFDSLLAANAATIASLPPGTLPAEFEMLIDGYSTGMLLEATVHCEIGLVIERTLAVSYSRRYGTENYNTSPVIGDISMLIMDEDEEVTSLEDLAGTVYDSVLLYSSTAPVAEPESILIDVNKKYYLTYTHDTEQEFLYYSVIDSSLRTGTEVYDNDWCYSNLDPVSMAQDSLIVMAGSRLLPPVDTGMHNFRVYLLVHDNRAEYGPTQGIGTAFAEVYGYFKYTDAYQAEHR